MRTMDCNELVELVTAYLDGALDAETRASFEEHLLDCDGCGNYLEQFRVTIATVGTIGSGELDPHYRSRLIETFRDWHRYPAATPERWRWTCSCNGQSKTRHIPTYDEFQARLGIELRGPFMSSTLTRKLALAAGGLAIVGMGALSACSTATKVKPAETTAPSQSSPAPSSNAPSPTEKAVGGGGNSFSPSVKARPAPTALPGNVITGN